MKGPASRAEAGVADAAKAAPIGKAALPKEPSYTGSYYILLDAVSHPAMNAFRAKRRLWQRKKSDLKRSPSFPPSVVN
jgi:hypothetical protein